MTEKRNLAGHEEREELKIGQDSVKRIKKRVSRLEIGENEAPQTISVAGEPLSPASVVTLQSVVQYL